MEFKHKDLAKGRWQTLSLAQQLSNIGSEVSRTMKWKDKDTNLFWGAVGRTLELFELTLNDPRHKMRLKELTRLHEIFCDAVLGGQEYNSDLKFLEQYFLYFTLYSRINKNN